MDCSLVGLVCCVDVQDVDILFNSADAEAWQKGVLYAQGQNLARSLMEAPANHVTPTVFAEMMEEKLSAYSDTVTVHKR